MLIEQLKRIVGSGGWLSEPAELAPYLSEWRGTWHGETPLMLMPASTGEVAEIVSARAGSRVGISQGGNTGLRGGAIPDRSGQQIPAVPAPHEPHSCSGPWKDYPVIAEAGCVLADLQRAAQAADRLFPLSLAAEGTCQIGGNLSTNAGGVNVLRYGTARDQVLGLEVVLADGRVLNGLRTLRKDTAGYDLKQVFIGAEGTLGIITAASLKLYPPVARVGTAWLAVDSAARAVSLLASLRDRLADRLLAFELIPDAAQQFVLRHIGNTRAPLDTPSPLVRAAGDSTG
ncbi:MAG: FAD-binding oxidoreductase [Woeseiaceae bacterium]|nr:FAD-binding oxidoreductase [Woeseiaceae bacterium]